MLPVHVARKRTYSEKDGGVNQLCKLPSVMERVCCIGQCISALKVLHCTSQTHLMLQRGSVYIYRLYTLLIFLPYQPWEKRGIAIKRSIHTSLQRALVSPHAALSTLASVGTVKYEHQTCQKTHQQEHSPLNNCSNKFLFVPAVLKSGSIYTPLGEAPQRCSHMASL